jgi:hypothetical protein
LGVVVAVTLRTVLEVLGGVEAVLIIPDRMAAAAEAHKEKLAALRQQALAVVVAYQQLAVMVQV